MSRAMLGRGLAALIPQELEDSAPHASPRDRLERVRLDEVRPNPEQPRRAFAAAALEELAASIREHGVLVPIVVRREVDGGLTLIAGERRLRASRLAGRADIPAVIRGAPTPADQQLELALVENLQRADLDAVEAARGYQRLIQVYRLTQEDVARRVGKDRATVANALRLLRLPEAGLRALQEGRITPGHARALLPLEHPDRFAAALAMVVARSLSVRGTESLVRQLLRPPPAPRNNRSFERLSDELTRQLGARAKVKPRRKGGGSISIEYANVEDLDRLIGLMSR